MSNREPQILPALAKGAQIDGNADGPGIAEWQVREHIARAGTQPDRAAASMRWGTIIWIAAVEG